MLAKPPAARNGGGGWHTPGNRVAAMRYILLGHPDNRRVTMFQDELAAAGLPPATVVSYRDLIADPGVLDDLPDEPCIVRQDAAGGDFDVERALLRLGYDDAVAAGASALAPDAIADLAPDRGRILHPRQQHFGLVRVLEQLAAIYRRHPAWRVQAPPASVAEMFDKRQTWRRWRTMGIPVADALEDVADYDDLRARVAERDWRTLFVKVSCSSSASCLAIYHRGGDRDWILTTIEHRGPRWYNSLRLRRYNDRRVGEILDFLLAEGAQVERRVVKARLGGHPFDLRIVTVADEPVFTVVRQSRHPITNLHLGGWRGDPRELAARLPPAVRAGIDDACQRISAASGCFRLGIDVAVERGFAGYRVLEANAFGDLLPNLERDGLSVYGWQIRAARDGRDARGPRVSMS